MSKAATGPSLRRRWKPQRSRESHVREGALALRNLRVEVVWVHRPFGVRWKGRSDERGFGSEEEDEGFPFFVDVPVISMATLSFAAATALAPKSPISSFNWLSFTACFWFWPNNLGVQYFIFVFCFLLLLNNMFVQMKKPWVLEERTKT